MINIAIDIYSLKLEDIIPQNLLIDDNIKAIAQALNPELSLTASSSNDTLIIPRINELPENLLDILASQFHADFYDLAHDLESKRDFVENSLLWHMKKGTSWAIIKALSMIGVEGKFIAWWQDNSEPYSFKIKANVTGDFYKTSGRDKLISSIRRAVNESKSARSYFAGLETEINLNENILIHAGLINALTGNVIIKPEHVKLPDKSRIFYGLARGLTGHVTIRPEHEREIDSKIFTAHPVIMNISHDISLEEIQLHELLLRFEERIISRLDALEKKFTLELNEHETKLDSSLNEIKDMLRWKGPDDPLD